MSVPDFVLELRRHVGTAPLWLAGATAVIRDADRALYEAKSGGRGQFRLRAANG